MADFRGLEGVSNSLVRLLQGSYSSSDFGNDLLFQVYVSDSFMQPMSAGVSIFLYRVLVNGSHRVPPGRFSPDGSRLRPMLPVDAHYLLTIWARDASLQHRIAGWVMRTIEDTPVLPFGLLEAAAPGVFDPNETVEIMPADLPNEDLFRIWETLGQNRYQLSIPYLVRNLRLASRDSMTEGEPVQERVFPQATIIRPSPSK
jgi:hypothetical protein